MWWLCDELFSLSEMATTKDEVRILTVAHLNPLCYIPSRGSK